MGDLYQVMKEFERDYLEEISNIQPELVDLLILTCHSSEIKKKAILDELTHNIKLSYMKNNMNNLSISNRWIRTVEYDSPVIKGSIRIMRIYNVKTKNLVSIGSTLLIWNQ